jgi:hypothetical protein
MRLTYASCIEILNRLGKGLREEEELLERVKAHERREELEAALLLVGARALLAI